MLGRLLEFIPSAYSPGAFANHFCYKQGCEDYEFLLLILLQVFKAHFNVCCSLQKHGSRRRRTKCQCSLEVAGLGQQLSSLALLSIMSSLFQSPFQATN